MRSIHDARIGRLLGVAYSLWQRETYGTLVDMGFDEVRPSHSPVFRFIDPEGTRIVDLSDRAGMTKQSMAYLVRSMEERGLLRVLPDPEDARARRVVLNERGLDAAAALVEASMRAEAAMMRRFGGGKVEDLRKLLGALVDWDFQGEGAS